MNNTQLPITQKAHGTWSYLVAAMLALAVVHTLGRFSFTPLLPHFISDHFLTIAQGADLASGNYVGYLLGALAAIYFSSPQRMKPMLLISLVCNVVLIFFQSVTPQFWGLMVWRVLNGMSNGLVFVLAPALVLEWLMAHQKAHLSGLVYLGVGGGLIMSGLLVTGTAPYFVAEKRWLPIAWLACPLALYSAYYFYRMVLPDAPKTNAVIASGQPLWDKNSTPLFLHYMGAGLGYILPMTFLPTLAKTVNSPNLAWAEQVWLVMAVVCVLFTPFWNHFGHRFGDRLALLWTSILQGLGMLAVLIWPNHIGVVLCAVLVGCGFLGSVMCTQRLARVLQPTQGPKLSAALITIYAGAQLTAPWLAKWLMQQGFSLNQTFLLGFFAFVWSVCFICFIPKK